MSMDVVTEQQHRALGFVSACLSSGYHPTQSELAAWLADPIPRGAVRSSRWWTAHDEVLSQLRSVLADWGGEVVEPAETVGDHLVRIGWLELGDEDRLSLTRLGVALYATTERSMVTATAPTVAVLGKDDPLAYPFLIAELSEAGEGFLLDPYLKFQQLWDIMQHTKIRRVLVKKMGSTESDLRAMSALLGSPGAPRQLDVRYTEDRTFHDRWFIGADSTVKTIGASMNAVAAGVLTVVSPIPEAAAAKLVEQSEAWWAGATPLRAPAVDEASQSEAASSSEET